jgi:hypothetical protein
MPFTSPATGMLPFSGRTPRQRHNSYRAAMGQVSTRGVKKLKMLAFIREHGRVTDQGLAEGLALPIQSICSLRNALCAEGLVRDVDTAIGTFGKRVTVYGPVETARERSA